jgi:hypothetical protein
MAKTDFKKVSIKQGRDLTVINEKPITYVSIITHDNKEISIEWDTNYNSFCITTSGDIDVIGEEQNAVYFKIKK